jgi:hypothetical protein
VIRRAICQVLLKTYSCVESAICDMLSLSTLTFLWRGMSQSRQGPLARGTLIWPPTLDSSRTCLQVRVGDTAFHKTTKLIVLILNRCPSWLTSMRGPENGSDHQNQPH